MPKIVKPTSPNTVFHTNQKAVLICKNREKEGPKDIRVDNVFKKECIKAFQELTPSGVKLYYYLLFNQDSYIGALSRDDVMETMRMSSKSYSTAVNELIRKGILIETDTICMDYRERTSAILYKFVANF